MNNTRTTTLLSITLSAVLLTGIIAPSLPQAFADNDPSPCEPQLNNDGKLSIQDNICIPNFFEASNSVNRQWADLGVVGDAGDCANADQSTGLVVTGSSEGASGFQLWPAEASFTDETDGTSFFIPNFQDALPFKDIRVQLTFCQLDDAPNQPDIRSIVATDNGQQSACSFVAGGNNQPTGPDTQGALYFFEDWFCEPNPDFEDIEIIYDRGDWLLVQVVIDTWSFGDVVGGVFEGVNTGALLVAGAQANALWLIPLITAVSVVGIVIVKRKSF